MIRINLLGETLAQAAGKKPEKAELAPVYGREGTRSSFPLAGLIAGLLLASVGGVYYVSLNGKVEAETLRKADLERQKDDLQKYIQLEAKFRQQKESLQKKKEVMVGLRIAQQMPVHLMEELANCLPDDVWFEDITQKGKNITIKGRGASYEAIELFRSHLQDDKTWFQNVIWPGGTKTGSAFVDFSISFDLKTPPTA
jgi:Tfp pilus assembly protein PilN